MAPLKSKGRFDRPLWSQAQVVKAIGEEVVSWKRRVESYITTNHKFTKANLTLATLSLLTFSGFALANVDMPSVNTTVLDKPVQAVEKKAPVLVARAFTTDNYLEEMFGSPVPDQMSPAESVVRKVVIPPMPVLESAVDNGEPPVPVEKVAMATRALTPPNSKISSRSLLWPMRGGQVSSRYGMRWGRMHQGTDISAPTGTPIMAAGDGKVIFSGWQGAYGQLVVIDHGNGTKTKYGHCSKLLVRVGQHVSQGDVIAKVGSTGRSTGPHLHYEVVNAGKANNPEFFTRRR